MHHFLLKMNPFWWKTIFRNSSATILTYNIIQNLVLGEAIYENQQTRKLVYEQKTTSLNNTSLKISLMLECYEFWRLEYSFS